MVVLGARNVHEALPLGVNLLHAHGIKRESRNGPVLCAPWPVTTVYERPIERVLFHPERDANPFFHLYESLWMLQGRNDVRPLLRYAKQMGAYSDDMVTLHGAYGHRWRNHFKLQHSAVIHGATGLDQLEVIAATLHANQDDRRCILQMWDAEADLGKRGKDVPCNTLATLQRNSEGALDLTVFCRSNDIIWGAYGANAVHFSVLQEYMANWIGCEVGRFFQVSVNWHAYLNTLESVKDLVLAANPYDAKVNPIAMSLDHTKLDWWIGELLAHDETGFNLPWDKPNDPFIEMAYTMFRAHHEFRNGLAPEKYEKARQVLALGDQQCDWIVAGREWIERRKLAWYTKSGNPQ